MSPSAISANSLVAVKIKKADKKAIADEMTREELNVFLIQLKVNHRRHQIKPSVV